MSFKEDLRNQFQHVCRSGDIQHLKDFLLYMGGRVIPFCRREFFMAASNGDIPIMEILFEYGTLTPTDATDGLMATMSTGNYSALEWLYTHGADLNFHDDMLFVALCRGGKLEEAKTVYRNSQVNIHTRENAAFKQAIAARQFHVVEWLLTLDRAAKNWPLTNVAMEIIRNRRIERKWWARWRKAVEKKYREHRN